MEEMVEDINNLLNSGEVPNLYTAEEKIELCDKIRVIDKQRDKSLQVCHRLRLILKDSQSSKWGI